jgi:hypothetical protein
MVSKNTCVQKLLTAVKTRIQSMNITVMIMVGRRGDVAGSSPLEGHLPSTSPAAAAAAY